MSQQLQTQCCCGPLEPCPPCAPPLCFSSYAVQVSFSGTYIDTLDGFPGTPNVEVAFSFSGEGFIALQLDIRCRLIGLQFGTLSIQADAPWAQDLPENSVTEYVCDARQMSTFVDFQFPFTPIRRLIDFRAFGVPYGPCVIDVQDYVNANRILTVTRPQQSLPPLQSSISSFELIIT